MDFFSFDTTWQESTIYVTLSATLYFSLLLATSLRVIIKRKPIGISLAWLFLIYVVPLLGIIGYFIFGELHLGKKREKRSTEMSENFRQWLKSEVQ